MPLIPTFGREKTNEDTIKVLEYEIIRTLNSAAIHLRKHSDLSNKWFGDDSGIWLAELSTKLERLPKLIQYHDIHISPVFREAEDSRLVARSQQISTKDYTLDESYNEIISFPRPRPELFHINVGRMWCAEPLYCDHRNTESQFQALFFQITRVLLATENHTSLYDECIILAKTNNAQAKRNANNWGYYLEAFRNAYYWPTADQVPGIELKLAGDRDPEFEAKLKARSEARKLERERERELKKQKSSALVSESTHF
jgi:hypothetical protein